MPWLQAGVMTITLWRLKVNHHCFLKKSKTSQFAINAPEQQQPTVFKCIGKSAPFRTVSGPKQIVDEWVNKIAQT